MMTLLLTFVAATWTHSLDLVIDDFINMMKYLFSTIIYYKIKGNIVMFCNSPLIIILYNTTLM